MIDAANNKRPAASPPHPACTCGSLRKASRRLSQFYDAALAPLGIRSTQYAILVEVERGSAAGAVGVCELAAAMIMDRSSLGHSLRPLERDQLLLVRPSSSDRRRRCVKLTRKGRALLRRASQAWRGAEDRFEDVYGKQPAAELRAALLTIAGNRDLCCRPTR